MFFILLLLQFLSLLVLLRIQLLLLLLIFLIQLWVTRVRCRRSFGDPARICRQGPVEQLSARWGYGLGNGLRVEVEGNYRTSGAR